MPRDGDGLVFAVPVPGHLNGYRAERRLDRPLVRAVPRAAGVLPGWVVFAVAERCAYLRPQQRFDRLLRHDEHGLPHRSLETFGFRYRFLN